MTPAKGLPVNEAVVPGPLPPVAVVVGLVVVEGGSEVGLVDAEVGTEVGGREVELEVVELEVVEVVVGLLEPGRH